MSRRARYIRRSAETEAQRLDDGHDLREAMQWAEDNGIDAAIHGDELVLWNHLGARVTGRLGQWLVMDESGAFNVCDDGAFHGERPEFTRVLTHSAKGFGT